MTEFRMMGLGVYRRRDGGLKTIKDHYPDNVLPWVDEQEDDYSDDGEVICGGGVDDLVECVWLFPETDQPESVKHLKEYQDYTKQHQPASVLALNLTPKPIPLAEMTWRSFAEIGFQYVDDPLGWSASKHTDAGYVAADEIGAELRVKAPHVTRDLLLQLKAILDQAGQAKQHE